MHGQHNSGTEQNLVIFKKISIKHKKITISFSDDDVMHLSHRSQIAPSARKTEKRRIFYLDLFRLKKRYPEFTHVVIKILPASEPRPVSSMILLKIVL